MFRAPGVFHVIRAAVACVAIAGFAVGVGVLIGGAIYGFDLGPVEVR